MPNQLSKTKRRKSLSEHEAVLALLEEIACQENTTSMNLMRKAIRELIKRYLATCSNPEHFNTLLNDLAPSTSEPFTTAKRVAQFKQQQREFDKILLDLNLTDSKTLEAENSIVSPQCNLHILELN